MWLIDLVSANILFCWLIVVRDIGSASLNCYSVIKKDYYDCLIYIYSTVRYRSSRFMLVRFWKSCGKYTTPDCGIVQNWPLANYCSSPETFELWGIKFAKRTQNSTQEQFLKTICKTTNATRITFWAHYNSDYFTNTIPQFLNIVTRWKK